MSIILFYSPFKVFKGNNFKIITSLSVIYGIINDYIGYLSIILSII
jgi:hypothetical protein